MESKYTKAERHEIYKKAKVYLIERKCKYMCVLLGDSAKEILNEYHLSCESRSIFVTEINYPEFFSIKPIETYSKHIWFDPYDVKSRVEILDKCIEMTKP